MLNPKLLAGSNAFARVPNRPMAGSVPALARLVASAFMRILSPDLRRAAITLGALPAALLSVSAQTNWNLTSAPTTPYWYSIASSADGNILVAAMYISGSFKPGPIYISTNSGSTWAPTGSPNNEWYYVACSADGQKLVATANYDKIYVSTNAGNTWVSNNVVMRWGPVASSSNGVKLVVAPANNHLSASGNSGLSWSVLGNSPSTNWNSVACSADGAKIFGCGGLGSVNNPGFVFASTNSGATWKAVFTQPIFGGVSTIACSADGVKLAAVGGSLGTVYTSTNAGATWVTNNVTTAPGGLYNIASSADGSRLVVAGEYSAGSPIYTSMDSGATWSLNNAPLLWWNGLASSADGKKLAAVTYYNAGIYTAQAPMSQIAPSLGIQVSGPGGVELSWTGAGGYSLQTNGNLATTNWSSYSGAVTTAGGTNSVTLEPPAGQLYFRLNQ